MEIKDLKILICDDSILVRSKMKATFEEKGCVNVYEAADGIQAVEQYKQINPDLVLMDIVMPVKSGTDALKEIKAFDKDALVVMASSVGTQSHLKNAVEAGAMDFLQKPISEEQIDKLIKNVIKRLG